MKPALALLLSALSLLLTACTRLVPFTHEMRVEHNLTPADIKNLQFYASSRMVLRRELESGGKQVTGNHKLLLVSGKTIEEVLVAEGTPGVAVQVSDRSIAISFENGTFMTFAAGAEPGTPRSSSPTFAEPPNPFPGNDGAARPEPFPQSPLASGTYWIGVDGSGRVPFQGIFFSPEDETVKAHLLVDAQRLEAIVKKRKVLPGVRLK